MGAGCRGPAAGRASLWTTLDTAPYTPDKGIDRLTRCRGIRATFQVSNVSVFVCVCVCARVFVCVCVFVCVYARVCPGRSFNHREGPRSWQCGSPVGTGQGPARGPGQARASLSHLSTGRPLFNCILLGVSRVITAGRALTRAWWLTPQYILFHLLSCQGSTLISLDWGNHTGNDFISP